MDDIGQIAISAGVGGLIMSVLTFFTTRGVDAWLKLKQDARLHKQEEHRRIMDDKAYEDARVEQVSTALITALQARVASLETVCQRYELDISSMRALHDQETAELRADHTECLKVQGDLKANVAKLTEKVAALERHDSANKEHVAELKAAIEAKKAEG